MVLGMQDLLARRSHPPSEDAAGLLSFAIPSCSGMFFPGPKDPSARILPSESSAQSGEAGAAVAITVLRQEVVFLHIALFKRLFACRRESLGCAKPEGRTHGTGVTRRMQLPSSLIVAQASIHLMSYANP